MGISAGHRSGRGAIGPVHGAALVTGHQQVVRCGPMKVAHLVEVASAAFAEPELIALRIELRHEDVVRHCVRVHHIEGERVVELASHIELIIRSADDVHC